MASIIGKQAASEDDARQLITTGAVTLTDVTARISSTAHVGFRFPNITIPPGSTINSATLQFDELQNYTGSGTVGGVTIYGHDIADSAAFTTASNNIGSRTRTTANVTGITASPSSYDVNAIIAEIIDRSDWASGNAISLLFIGSGAADSGFIQPYMWDYLTGFYFAELTIDYTPPPLLETLTDDFNDNSLDTAKWFIHTGTGTSITEDSSRITISTGATSSDTSLISVSSYDFIGSYVLLELVSLTAHTSANFAINLYDPTFTDFLYLTIQGSTLKAGTLTVPGTNPITSTTYSPTNHRWLRIRETSGTIYWETSADAVVWSTLTSLATFSALGNMVVDIIMLSTSSAGVLSAVIDNFNLLRAEATVTIIGTSSLTSSAHVTYHPSITITGTSTLSALGFSLADQSKVDKTYMYKVYDTDDSFLGIWDDVVSDLTYDHEINSAGASIQVDLARNSDSRIIQLEGLLTTSGESITTQDANDIVVALKSTNAIGPGSNVDVNYRVEVWVFYGEITELSTTSGEVITTESDEPIMVNFGAVNGTRKFHGYITRYVSRYGGEETVQVSIASFGAELDNYVLENGTATTVAYSSADPGNIVKDALDKFTAAGGLLDYVGSSVQTTSTSVSYTFRLNTYLEVLRKALELAPSDWYWWAGLGDDTVYFQERPSTASHTFILGKHVQELNLEYSIENITNLVYFVGGEVSADTNLFKKYTDATSITNYRQGLQRITDHRVTLAASAEIIAEGEIDRNSVPRYRSSITILDKTYDIESIQLGQLITFRNFGNYIDDLSLQIVGMRYEPDRVVLQLDTLLPSVNKRVEDIRRNLIELDNEQVPSAPS